ncbi:VapE domain-containing protein [Pantoea vagans]|uniref:VapE domain-containing protein n=1 Tax=Pantoea vagans TaxID=470934 RepID=UPI00289F735F|nr:VapE domain-containing protein [Pantoea vagans]
MNNVISDKLENQSEPVQNIVEFNPKKKKSQYKFGVTFGATWWKGSDDPGKPQGTHEAKDVYPAVANLDVLKGLLESRARSLDSSLPLQVAKTRQPYIVWSGLNEINYRDKNGDMVNGIVRRAPAVMPSRLLPFDIDGAHTRAINAIKDWLTEKNIGYIAYHTASDQPTNGANLPSRRMRLVVLCDELLPYVKEACCRFEKQMMAELGATVKSNTWTLPDGSTVLFDRSMYDPAHFAFLPPKGNKIALLKGDVVRIADLPELDQEMQHAVRTSHHGKDHAKRMDEFNRSPEMNKEALRFALWNELSHRANNNARSDGTYGWGTICGALGDFIGTEHEEWAADLLVEWSMAFGGKWANEAGINGDENSWEESIRAEFGNWQNPYKTIFDLARKAKNARMQGELTDDDLADEPALPAAVKKKKALPKVTNEVSGKTSPEDQFKWETVARGKSVVRIDSDVNLHMLFKTYGIRAALNTMTYDIDVSFNGEIVSDAGIYLSRIKSCAAREELPKEIVTTHLYAVAQKAKYHPVSALLHGRQWDGVERVNDVLKCFTFKAPEYAHAVMRKWLISAVAAVFAENFEAKLVPVLVGDQSRFKSSAINRLASLVDNALIEEVPDPKDRDSLRRGVGHWIAEWAELETLSKRDTGMMKNFISRRVDHYRVPYGHGDVAKPRQTVFIGSANGCAFLQDKTGNVRFAPLEIGGLIDINRIDALLGWKWKGAVVRENPEELIQFWLEVKSWFDAGELWHMTPELAALQAEVNRRFTATSDIEVQVGDWLSDNDSSPRAWRSCTQIAADLGLPKNMLQKLGEHLKSRPDIQTKERGTKPNQYLWPVAGASDLND